MTYIIHSLAWGAAGLAIGYAIRLTVAAVDRRRREDIS